MKKHIIIAIIAFILGAACGIVGTVLVEKQDVQKEVTMEIATDTDATETDATITDATETDVTEEVTTEEVTEEPEVEKEEKEDILIAAPTPIIEATTEAPVVPAPQPEQPKYEPQPGDHLTKSGGVHYGPSGKETYYNLKMSGVVDIMRDMGFSEEEHTYEWCSIKCTKYGN